MGKFKKTGKIFSVLAALSIIVGSTAVPPEMQDTKVWAADTGSRMLVDLTKCSISFTELSDALKEKGEEMGVNIRIQREDIFDLMHRI